MTPQPEYDELARQYLLGRVSESQREQLGERLFADEEFYETVEAVEMELRDAYARKELSGRDRDDFETHLLRTERQRKASRVSSVLANRLPKRAHAPRRRWMQWALVAAAAIAIPGVFYAKWLQQQVRLPSPQQETSRFQSPSGEMPAVVSLFLPGMVLRGGDTLPELQLTAKETLVKLEVEVARPGPYLAVLADAFGKEIFRQDGMVPSDDAVRVWLSAASLPNGPVELRLSSKDMEERRRFRVSRKAAQFPSTTKPAQ